MSAKDAGGAKPRTPTDFTICRDCFQAWPTENLQDGNDKPCDCGDGTGTYFFHVLDREPVLDLMQGAASYFYGDEMIPLWAEHMKALLREHGRLQ